MAVDGSGNVFIADSVNNCIRKVNALGTISTIASGIAYPRGMAADNQGDIFVAVIYASDVVKVSPDGTITRIAGSGSVGFSGDGGSGVIAELYYPSGVAVDATGNVFIADWLNERIRKVSINSTPVILSFADPPFGIQGTAADFFINGTGLANATSINFSGTGITATIKESSDAMVHIRIQTAVDAAPGLRTVSVTTTNGTSADFSGFTILTGPPLITGITPSSGDVGTVVSATITGNNLSPASAVTVGGTGVIASVGDGATSTSLPLSFTILANAPLGARNVTVTTPFGAAIPFSGFTITAGLPVVTGMTPLQAHKAPLSMPPSPAELTGATQVTFSGTGVTAVVNTESNNNALAITIQIDRERRLESGRLR